jgi:hypothetical protein
VPSFPRTYESADAFLRIFISYLALQWLVSEKFQFLLPFYRPKTPYHRFCCYRYRHYGQCIITLSRHDVKFLSGLFFIQHHLFFMSTFILGPRLWYHCSLADQTVTKRGTCVQTEELEHTFRISTFYTDCIRSGYETQPPHWGAGCQLSEQMRAICHPVTITPAVTAFF